jgi:hypothetical protein
VNPPGAAYWVTEIVPDPFDENGATLSVAGYRSADTAPYVRVTHDLGSTWHDASAGLPQVPVNSVAPDPDWRGRMFAGTDVGVYVSDDLGLSWSVLGSGMPRVVVLDLVLDDPSRTLFAGTHGRSMYTYDLDQLPVPDGDGDGVDNNADCALGDPGAHAAPHEVPSLTVEKGAASSAVLAWDSLASSAGPGTVYDVAVGDLALLAASGTGSSTSLGCALAVLSVEDPGPLPAGGGAYYMVRGRNVCGIGSFGRDSQGNERASGACP